MSIRIPDHRTSINPEFLGEYRVREILYESQAPLIFTITTSFNQPMLAYVADELPEGDWVVLAPCGSSTISDLKEGRTSVREALTNSWIWLAFLEAGAKWTKAYAIEASDLPEEHLPRPGALLYPDLEPKSKDRVSSRRVRPEVR